MIRLLVYLFAFTALPLMAEDEVHPVISIDSPDTATTFAYGTLKHRALIWSDSAKTLFAEVTFVDEQQTNISGDEDTHRFRLPGVTFDKEHGIFYATSGQGEQVPIARRKKALIFSSIEVLPNAVVHVHHHRGIVNVSLEAIRPNEVGKVQKAEESGDDPGHTHGINFDEILR